MARIDYLEVADRLNATLPNEDKRYAKIYVWQHRYEPKKYGVEVCITGKMHDVAVDIRRRDIIPNIHKAYELAKTQLGLNS